MGDPSRLDDWLADFSMTESMLQIAAYPSLYPVVHLRNTVSIDPFLNAPATMSDTGPTSGDGNNSSTTQTGGPYHPPSTANSVSTSPAQVKSAQATAPPGALVPAPFAYLPHPGQPPHAQQYLLPGSAAAQDARSRDQGQQRAGVKVDPFAALPQAGSDFGGQLPPLQSAGAAQGSMVKIPLPSKSQSLMMMEAERLKRSAEVIDPEQDKKERNCAASARFRKKKREQYLAMERKAIEMEERYHRVMERKETLRTEKEYLEQLLAMLEAQGQAAEGESGATQNGSAATKQ